MITMSKTQAALQRRLGRLSMLVDITAQFPVNSSYLNRLRNEVGNLKDPTQTPVLLSRSVGRARVLVEQIGKELPDQKEMIDAMLTELDKVGEIISRLDEDTDQRRTLVPRQSPKARGRR